MTYVRNVLDRAMRRIVVDVGDERQTQTSM